MSEISQYHQLAKVVKKTGHPIEISYDVIVSLDSEIVQLEAIADRQRKLLENAPDAGDIMLQEDWFYHYESWKAKVAKEIK